MIATVEEWNPQHPRWPELLLLIEQENQTGWVFADPPEKRGWHLLVALRDGAIVGFLMFLVQDIGPADDCPPLTVGGVVLTEAKIRAFGVPPQLRRQGIGAELQRAAIKMAAELGCYQVRSWSDTSHPENYAVKIKLGFAAVPQDRGTRQGYYWVMKVAP